MIFWPIPEVYIHKLGYSSVNIRQRDLKLLFLERKLNFALFAVIFWGLYFHNLSQSLREFFFPCVSSRFFADSALFCLIFFYRLNAQKKWCNQQKVYLFHFCRCITGYGFQPENSSRGSEKEAYSFAKWLGFKGLKSLRDIKPSRILIDCGDTIFFFLMEFDAQCANFIRNMRNQTLHLRNFFAFKYFLLKFCRIAEYRKAKKLIRFIV